MISILFLLSSLLKHHISIYLQLALCVLIFPFFENIAMAQWLVILISPLYPKLDTWQASFQHVQVVSLTHDHGWFSLPERRRFIVALPPLLAKKKKKKENTLPSFLNVCSQQQYHSSLTFTYNYLQYNPSHYSWSLSFARNFFNIQTFSWLVRSFLG